MAGPHATSDLPVSHRALDPVEAALTSLLERHPDAVLFAIGGEDAPEVAPMPAGLPAGGRSSEDLSPHLQDVVDEDLAVVARLWGEARTRGIAVGQVRPRRTPDEPATLYLLDVRRRFGVMIGIVAEGSVGPDHDTVEASSLPALAPRYSRSVKDAVALIRSVDAAFTSILGWSPEEVVGRRAVELIHPDDRPAGIAAWMEMLELPSQARPVRLRHRHRDGSWVWMEVTNHNRLEDPAHGDVLSEMLDISDEMAAHDALRAREQLLAQLTETVPLGLFHVDLAGTMLFANRRLHDIVGGAVGAGLDALLLCVVPEDRVGMRAALDAAGRGAEADVDVRVGAPGGAIRHCTVGIRPLRDDAGAVIGITGCVEDVTVTVRTLHELHEKAVSDSLTGCLNRSAVVATLQELLDRHRAAGSGQGTAVVFLDLDRFKPVNDRLGHAAGDELLLRVAQRIRGSVRLGDVVGRWGGDEFVVLCPGVPSATHALAVAQSLLRRVFGAASEGPDPGLGIRASAGVAWCDGPGMHAAVLVDQADSAMYESKRSGLGAPVLYGASSSATTSRNPASNESSERSEP